MEDWFSKLGSRQNALKTDAELKAELLDLVPRGQEKRDFVTRLDAFLAERQERKEKLTAKHKVAPPDAQKNQLRARN